MFQFLRLTIPDPETQPSPVRPADNLLASLLRNNKNLVYKYHEHDSLLENNSAEDLNEQEKADAWAAYENDVSMKSKFSFCYFTFTLEINKMIFSDQFGNVSKSPVYNVILSRRRRAKSLNRSWKIVFSKLAIFTSDCPIC